MGKKCGRDYTNDPDSDEDVKDNDFIKEKIEEEEEDYDNSITSL